MYKVTFNLTKLLNLGNYNFLSIILSNLPNFDIFIYSIYRIFNIIQYIF